MRLTVVLRPCGWSEARMPECTKGTPAPVILLHGLFQNRSCLFWMQHRLRAAGFKQIVSMNTPPGETWKH